MVRVKEGKNGEFQIIDPNAAASKRLIARTDFVDVAEIVARSYYAQRYGPEHNRYVHEAKPVIVRQWSEESQQYEIHSRWGMLLLPATGRFA